MKIGVFDSGVGGLTVLRALLARIPSAQYLYLGDTARLPYGSKSEATIARYAVSSSLFLIEQGAEFLVIACNTATALALPAIVTAACPNHVPVVGVIEPGAKQAAEADLSRSLSQSPVPDTRMDTMVIATSATVQSHAYAAACSQHGLRAIEKACPLLVPLVEEGWIDHPVTTQIVQIYLSELHDQSAEAGLHPSTLVLGCTHYPLLRSVIERTVRRLWPRQPPLVIDSAEATALEVTRHLAALPQSVIDSPSIQFFATDSTEKFRSLGSRFLNQPIAHVKLIDLGG